MIITRTPFRVSFVGGGTDIGDFYRQHGYGAVISAAIKKYMYIVIHPYFHDKMRIKYSKTEDVETSSEIEHPIVRECLRKVGLYKGLEIASFADISAGTGLGSSSAFTVGLLHALYAYKGESVSTERLAREACEIEIDILKEPIGKQDQYAVAFGNINSIRFNKDESVECVPLRISKQNCQALEQYLALYYVGGERNTRDVLTEQKENILSRVDTVKNLVCMLPLVDEMKKVLLSGSLDMAGGLLHKGWLIKKELATGITNTTIDAYYDKAIHHGALGGKLLGAGGTGFLLVYHKDHKRFKSEYGCRTIPFAIDTEGTKVIFSE
ncbi:MAG: GHMP kinase [Candidatus Omnitrophica bacterium]|nr:GHMP kinase [Candidatus Omnitrophota bacterium]